MTNRFISLVQVESNLTALCLHYLTFPSFVSEIPDDQLKGLVRRGQLAFHEYAIAHWTNHFLELIAAGAKAVESEGQLISAETSASSKSAFAEFERALEDFITLYGQDMKNATVEAAQECLAFSDSDYYEEIKQIWDMSKQYSIAPLDVRNKPCLESMEKALRRGQAMIEGLSIPEDASKDDSTDLDEYYGPTRFKCPKVTCYWFHVGFDNAKTRKAHVARHERPFRCEVSDCSGADMGFTNSKALEKHVRMLHPSLEYQAESFTALKPTPTKTPYACHLCPKRLLGTST